MTIRRIYKMAALMLLPLALASCKDDDTAFAPAIGPEAFSFYPIAGGAIMHYTLPDDEDVSGVSVRYKDYAGKECLVSGSALSDSLRIVGFNEAVSSVPAEVRLVRRNGEESAPVSVSFSTSDSGPVAFFQGVKVSSGWNGFSVSVDNPRGASGLAHIFYLGTNPYTNQPDTVLLTTFPIKEGRDTMVFQPQQKKDVNTIVIRTEDFRGYMVHQEVYPDIASYKTALLSPDNFTFFWKTCVESERYMLGAKYLFDGDTSGESWFDDYSESHYRFTMAGPDAIGDPMYIDMKENRPTAEVRMYAAQNIQDRYTTADYNQYSRILDNMPINKLPCDVDVYGAKDDAGSGTDWESKQWVRIGSYHQDADIDGKQRWCAYSWLDDDNYDFLPQYSTREAARGAKPIYMSVGIPADGQGEGYRYLKIVVNDTFLVPSWTESENNLRYVNLQELEIYTKE